MICNACHADRNTSPVSRENGHARPAKDSEDGLKNTVTSSGDTDQTLPAKSEDITTTTWPGETDKSKTQMRRLSAATLKVVTKECDTDTSSELSPNKIRLRVELPHEASNADATNDWAVGSVVWAGGRGYAGGLWDPWPARIIDPAWVDMPVVGPRQRAVSFFGHNRKFAVLSIAALKPYHPEVMNRSRRFRDPRGRMACVLADTYVEKYPSGTKGVVNDDELLALTPEHKIREAKAAAKVPASSQLEPTPESSLADARNKGVKRKQRTAAARNRFCMTGEDGRDAEPVLEGTDTDMHADPKTCRSRSRDWCSRFSQSLVAPPSYRYVPTPVRTDASSVGGSGHQDVSSVPAKKKIKLSSVYSPSAAGAAIKSHADGHDVGERSPANRMDDDTECDIAVMGIEDVSRAMARFVCCGYPADMDAARKRVSDLIRSRCRALLLNGAAILAAGWDVTTIASEVMGSSEGSSEPSRDGAFWAVANFATMARQSPVPPAISHAFRAG